jgi:phosphopantothenoylcysteine decarboxylase/phosphopantothenate--cysteine ligase
LPYPPHEAGAPPAPHEAGAPPAPHEAGALPGASRPGQVIVGFAAETELDLPGSRAKLARKGCDLLVVNRVGNGLAFGTSDNEAVVVGADGSQTDIPRAAKEVLADTVWDLVAARLL